MPFARVGLRQGAPDVAVLLELGMGIGSVALQCFAACSTHQAGDFGAF